MPDFVALVTPPILAGPDMKPANGDIYIRSTNTVSKSGLVVVPFQAHGKVVDGTFKALDGGPLMLVVTPEGVALEIHAELVQESPGGRKDKYRISRTVSTPNASTVTWDALVDVIPIDAGPDVVVPPWVAETKLARDEAAASATTAVNANDAAQAALTAIDQKVADVPTPAELAATYAKMPTGTRNTLTGWFHVDGFGAVGDGVTDARPAIQAAINAANAAGGGVVYLPAGVYLLGRGGASWNLLLKSNVAIRGAARDDVTLVQSAGAVTSERVFTTNNVATSNVVISALKIDGNKANQTVNEHRHAVFLQNASRVIVRDVEIYGMSGGGVSLYTTCSDITIENSYIHDVDRGCVEATGGDTYRLAIRNNRLTIPAASGAQPIDLEVENTGNGHAEDVTITNNIVTTTMPGGYAISCASVANYNQRVIISGNTLTGGINCYGSQGTSIINNTITSIGGDRAILANAKVIDLLISGNQITTTAGTVYAIESGLSLSAQPNGVCITGNQINAVTGGIKLTGTKTVLVTGNTIRAAGTASAVWVQATANMESTVITGNTLINTGATAIDIQTFSTNTFKSLVVTNNAVVDDQATATVLRGVRLAGAAAQFLNTSVQGNTVTASIATNFLDSTTGGPVAGKLNFSAVTVGTTAPAAGAAGALPAAPTGYLTVTIGNTDRKVAYY